MIKNITISKTNDNNIKEVIELFNQYRVFYRQESNIEAAANFINERFRLKDSVVFIATDDETKRALGFVQLYPSYSSVSMGRVWILNDLFVEKYSREQGVAKKLMEQVKLFAQETNAVRVDLATELNNINAQKLYESQGYSRDEEYYHYNLCQW